MLGDSLNKIIIDVQKKKIKFVSKKGVFIFNCEIGEKGYSSLGKGKEDDKKTPIGNFNIKFIRKPLEGEFSVFTLEGNPKKNLGPIFICLDCKYEGKLRGIGIHGSEDNKLKPTDGCIRMYNHDLNFIKNIIKKGIPVIIN